MLKLAIVEDNHTLRKSLENLCQQAEGIDCVCSLGNLMNVVSELSKSEPDIVLMDIGLPNISGIEGVRTIRTNFPEMQVMMFTVFEDDDKIFEAIRAGASGYLLKKSSPEDIIEAIRELHCGGAPMTPSIARKVVNAFQAKPSDALGNNLLTVREKEILFSLVDGLSYKKIADKYCISISTVRTHICNVYAKLHVHTKGEAVAKVMKK
jgi:DNA-binding NarL/FixJ family response regulator